MNCRSCDNAIASEGQLFFFAKGAKEVHLSIKPEQFYILQTKNFFEERESKKKVRVKCIKCKANLGLVLPHGPDASQFRAFACDKVVLCGRRLTHNERWWSTYKEFIAIECRDFMNYYGCLTQEPMEVESVPLPQQKKIIFPSLNNISDFEWLTVLQCLKYKKPHPYQIQAYIEALQRNLIVVLQTGCGKTLIASMLIGKMCSLNPDKMGLFIVDRIPLVFQQGNAIKSDTNLDVVSLCGENKTEWKIQRIKDCYYDVLVVTAGAFVELVKNHRVPESLFCVVVFDECHHLSKGHAYIDVMNLFLMMSLADQPRMLGLSASPVNAKNVTQAGNRLERFLSNFSFPKIFSPALPKTGQSVIKEAITFSLNQTKFIKFVVDILNKHLENIYKINEIKGLYATEDLLNLFQLTGELRVIKNNYMDLNGLHNSLQLAHLYINVIESCVMFGVSAANEHLKEVYKNVSYFDDISEISPRLKKLYEILKSFEKSKVLVFVNTRNIARALLEHLKRDFSQFNPMLLVGHGGFDGMDWEDDQESTIEEFSHGGCNLIVCTSVLEEGLDVKLCDLVVCFTGIKNLIQFIQIKGRCRKSSGRFYIFQSQNEYKNMVEIEENEEMMKQVMKRFQDRHCLFSQVSRDIIKKILDEMNLEETEENNPLPSNEESKIHDLSFIIYVENVKSVKLAKECLIKQLEECDDFKVQRLTDIKIPAQIQSLTKRVFSNDCVSFLVTVKTKNKDFSALETFHRFCKSFSFELKIEGKDLTMWAKLHLKPSKFVENLQSRIIKFGLGYFVNRLSCCIKKEFYLDGFVSFEIGGFEIKSDEILVNVRYTSLVSVSILSIDESSFTLNVLLSHPPQVQNEDLRKYFSMHPLLQITFNMQQLDTLRKVVQTPSLFPILMFYAKLSVSQQPNFTLREDSDEFNWYLRIISDSRMLCMPHLPQNKLNDFLQKLSPLSNEMLEYNLEVAIKLLYADLEQIPYFDDFFRHFEKRFHLVSQVSKSKSLLLKATVPANHHMIKRAVLTPSHVIAMTEIPIATNRLLRLVADDELLLVYFREEDKTKLQCNFEFVKEALTHGFQIAGSTYMFLLSSASQLRSHNAYFIRTEDYESVLEIRSKIIPSPESFISAAKYLSRLGLYSTADNTCFKLQTHEFTVFEDLRASNQHLTTDGAGKISHAMATKLASKMNLSKIPSVFQVRFAGFKGILLYAIDSDEELKGHAIVFRPSMKKFVNSDTDLCVVSTSKLIELRLNREIVTLLSSMEEYFVSNFYRVLMEYQESTLTDAAGMFTNDCLARSALEELIQYQKLDYLVKFKLGDEQFWYSVLQGVYRLKIKELLKKVNIPIKKGCVVVGAPEPFSELNEGEIFLQIEFESGEKQVIEGPVILYRNPCLHPGDVRKMKAVNKPNLSHLYNVVVFPAYNCEQSLAEMCSGGDLDGDQYSVIWDSALIPEDSDIFPPCDYSLLAVQRTEQVPIDVTDATHLASFFCNVLEKDCLGLVAVRHLALCDILRAGARDPLAIEFSKAQAQAVDFPKTGIAPEVPLEALNVIKNSGYPHFMEKSAENSYFSTKIIGSLYNRCKSVGFSFNATGKYSVQGLDLSMFYVDGHQEFLEEAANVYVCYSSNMKMLISQFELRTEVDVVLGRATENWSQFFEVDKGRASKAIVASYCDIMRKYREVFFQNVGNDPMIKMQKASAWYRLVHDPEIVIPGHSVKMLSFPWIVYDVLCEIKDQLQVVNQPSRVLMDIGLSAVNLFQEHSSTLLKSISEKQQTIHVVQKAIDRFVKDLYKLPKSIKAVMYGSTSIYVCEPESDLDICLLVDKELDSKLPSANESNDEYSNREKYILELIVSRAINSIACEKRGIYSTKVPIIKCAIGSEDYHMKCDISLNKVGLRKTDYIRTLYRKNCYYLPLFWILVKWARSVGLVKSKSSEKGSMDTAEFYAVVIHLLGCQLNESAIQRSKKTNLNHLYNSLNMISIGDKYILGQMIYTFFRKASYLEGNLEFPWPTLNVTSLDASTVVHLASNANNAFHCLCNSRNTKVLFLHILESFGSQTTYTKVLPMSISYAIGKAIEFHSTRLSVMTGARVHFVAVEGKLNLRVHAEGTAFAITMLSKEFSALISTNKAITLGRLPMKTSRYFMEGSTFVMVEGETMQTCPKLTFQESLGAYEVVHSSCRRDFICKKKENIENDWKEAELKRFCSLITKQLASFPAEFGGIIDITVRFGCFYLIDVGTCLPDYQRSISLAELELYMETGRAVRKQWKRGEFVGRVTEKSSKDEESFRMVTLESKKSTFATETKKKIKLKRTRKGILSAFTPGLLRLNTTDESPRLKLLDVYERVLLECGFQSGQSNNRLSSTWKVSLNPSSSFELNMYLNEDLELLHLAERPLHWVHATLINRQLPKFKDQIQTTPDLRLTICTEDPVPEGSKLYQTVLPVVNGQNVIPITIKDGNPVLIRGQSKTLSYCVRHMPVLKNLTNGSVDARIVYGMAFYGSKLELKRPFCDLSLYFNPQKVKAIVGSFVSSDEVRKFAEEFLETSLKVKEKLEQLLG